MKENKVMMIGVAFGYVWTAAAALVSYACLKKDSDKQWNKYKEERKN